MTGAGAPFLPYGRQNIGEAEIAAVTDVLRSDFLTQGDRVPAFEAAICAAVDAPFCVAVNSATSALHMACLALGLGPGRLMWTSPNSFVASANAARMCGADVDFVDIDPATANLSVDALADRLAAAEQDGRLPDVVMVVHFAGEPCDMPGIAALAGRYGFRIIEDASHAMGARVGSRRIGACDYSDITVFSFHPVKIVTTAEGGAATTRDADLAARLERLRSHGITRDPRSMTQAPEGPWVYEQIELGYNYRMTDIQAALGVVQMTRLEAFLTARHALADRYDALLEDLPVTSLTRRGGNRSALHLYVIRVAAAERSRLFAHFRDGGIGVQVHYIPIHTQPYYRALGFQPGQFPEAERHYAEAISLPLHPALRAEDQDRVVAVLREGLDA